MGKMKKEHPQRSVTVSWEDPRIIVKKGQSMTGLDLLEGIRKGLIPPPPAAKLLGYRVSEITEGRTIFDLDPGEHHYNPFGTVHGGILSTLLDTAMTSAVMTTLPSHARCSTLEIKVNFIRPMTGRTGRVHGTAETIHVGTRIATAEGRIVDRAGDLYAHAVSTIMIFSAPKPK